MDPAGDGRAAIAASRSHCWQQCCSGLAGPLNAEGVSTALLAWIVFRENVDRHIAIGMAVIVTGAALLRVPAGVQLGSGWPSFGWEELLCTKRERPATPDPIDEIVATLHDVRPDVRRHRRPLPNHEHLERSVASGAGNWLPGHRP